MSEWEFDVAKSIRMTEDLQCQMLAQLSDFYTALHRNASKTEKTEILANMEVALYLMAERLGISAEAVDRKAAANIRLGLLQEDNGPWREALLSGLHRLER